MVTFFSEFIVGWRKKTLPFWYLSYKFSKLVVGIHFEAATAAILKRKVRESSDFGESYRAISGSFSVFVQYSVGTYYRIPEVTEPECSPFSGVDGVKREKKSFLRRS